MKLEDDRKCWRLVNGVLFEKTNAEVRPELKQMISNLTQVIRQLQEALMQKKQESSQLEQAYETIMKQAKQQKVEQGDEKEMKSSGVLV